MGALCCCIGKSQETPLVIPGKKNQRNSEHEDRAILIQAAATENEFMREKKEKRESQIQSRVGSEIDSVRKRSFKDDVPSENLPIWSNAKKNSNPENFENGKSKKKDKNASKNQRQSDSIVSTNSSSMDKPRRRKGSKKSGLRRSSAISKEKLLESWEERLNSEEEFRVPPGPLGILLSRKHSNVSIVEGFTPLPNGSRGLLESSNKIRAGSMLCKVNGVDVSHQPVETVIQMLKASQNMARVITFRSSKHDFMDM